MNAAEIVATILKSGGYEPVYTFAPYVSRSDKTIVVLEHGFERNALTGTVERGIAELELLVCRETAKESDALARDCERYLRTVAWESPYEACRLMAIDSTPDGRTRDSSGCFVSKIRLSLAIERDFSYGNQTELAIRLGESK